MILKQFRIRNYKGIEDSGEVDVGQLTVLVGKNESGKTSTLQALQKLKGAAPQTYDRLRDYPRGRNLKDFRPDLPVASALFDLSDVEIKRLTEIDPSLRAVRQVRVTRDYAGAYSYEFTPYQAPMTNRAARTKIEDFLETIGPKDVPSLRALLAALPQDDLPLAGTPEAIEATKSQLGPLGETDPGVLQGAVLLLSVLTPEAKQAAGFRAATPLIESWLPVFVYFDEYQTLPGRIDIPSFVDRRNRSVLNAEDETMKTLVSLAGLDLDELLRLDQAADKTERTLLTNRASLAVTGEVAQYWKQREYQAEFRLDGPTLTIWVKDNVDQALVALDERSKGFRWFFSFYVVFRAQSAAQFKGAILLLDEPGLHLHASAQEDLIRVLWRLAQNNQVIYTTHSPFMIDMDALENIRTCTETGGAGIKVSNNPWSTDRDAVFPLQAALGFGLSQSLAVGKENLLVEGPSDYWILTSLRRMFTAANKQSVNRAVALTQTAGASKMPGMAAMMSGQGLGVIALLDHDGAGNLARDDIVKNKVLPDKLVLSISAAFDQAKVPAEAELEDLFPEDFYVKYLNRAYAKELGNSPLTTPLQSKKPRLCARIEDGLGARGIPFHKTRAARLMAEDFQNQAPGDLPGTTVENFERLFKTVEAARAKLPKKSD